MLQYAVDQECEVIYLYDMGTLFDNFSNHVENNTINPTYGEVFNNFMTRARNTYNIPQIGAIIGSKPTLYDVIDYNTSRLYWCGETGVPTSGNEVESIIEDLKGDIEANESTESRCYALRNAKLLYQVYAYNNWGFNETYTSFNFETPFGSCDASILHFDRMTTEIEFWDDPATADAIYYGNYMNVLGLGACMRDVMRCPWSVDTYLGRLHVDNVDNQDQADIIDQKCDRVCINAYCDDPQKLFDYFEDPVNLRAAYFDNNSWNTEIWPIFSGEDDDWDDQTTHPKINMVDFLGPYLTDPAGYSWACAENYFQDEYDLNVTSSTNTIGGYVWYSNWALYYCPPNGPTHRKQTSKPNLPKTEINIGYMHNSKTLTIKLNHFNSNDQTTIRVVNVQGELLNDIIAGSEYSEIKTDNFSSGIYYVIVINNKGVYQRKKIVII